MKIKTREKSCNEKKTQQQKEKFDNKLGNTNQKKTTTNNKHEDKNIKGNNKK